MENDLQNEPKIDRQEEIIKQSREKNSKKTAAAVEQVVEEPDKAYRNSSPNESTMKF